jgi:hypothetical protein
VQSYRKTYNPIDLEKVKQADEGGSKGGGERIKIEEKV